MSISFKDLSTGIQVLQQFDSVKSEPKPGAPTLQLKYEYRQIEPHFADALQLMEIPENPVIFEATMQAIISSDHPMLMEAVRKLYALGKLCLDTDEKLIAHAQVHVRDTDEANRGIDESNKIKIDTFMQGMKRVHECVIKAQDNLVNWWNEYLIGVQEVFLLSNTLKQNPLYVQWTINALDQHRGSASIGKGTLPGWYNQRYPNMLVELFGGKPPENQHDVLYTALISKVITSVIDDHTRFINQARKEIGEMIRNSRDYKRELEDIEEYYSWYKLRHEHRFYDSHDDYKMVDPNSYKIVSWQERYDEEFLGLEESVEKAIDAELQKRCRNGIDGYDNIIEMKKK